LDNVPIGVFIAAENRLLREALFRLLENEKDIKVVGQAGHCSEAAEQMLKLCPDVFLLNPSSLALSDLNNLRRARVVPQKMKIVLFGMEEEERFFFEAVRQGVVGYVLKDAYAPDVVAAVRAAMRGEAVCPPRLCLLLFTYVARQGITFMPDLRLHLEFGLTRRERELLPMIARGHTNKEIAAQLNVSEQTVKNHIHRIIQKAGASNRLEIVERCRLQEVVN
jgi:DNA-binding NarL/FixJ family response regulator